MRRHINSTKRARITRQEAPVSILQNQIEGSDVFDLKLNLNPQHNFPPDAIIRVEATRSNVSQRWNFGTVGNQIIPTVQERRLTDIESTTFFRVFVVEPGTGKLLGLANHIRPVQRLDSLIPLVEDGGDRLGTEIWRVDFTNSEHEGPVLLVNNGVPTIGDIVGNDATFRSLVMPQVLRQVLSHMVYVERRDPDDKEESWESDWFRFVDYLGVKPAIGMTWGANLNKEAAQEWIDEAVKVFSAKSVRPVRSYSDALGGAR